MPTDEDKTGWFCWKCRGTYPTHEDFCEGDSWRKPWKNRSGLLEPDPWKRQSQMWNVKFEGGHSQCQICRICAEAIELQAKQLRELETKVATLDAVIKVHLMKHNGEL